MADHAGFAAAVTVREHVLRIALLAAYANGAFPKALKATLPDDPPVVAADLFLGLPGIECEGATNLLVLTAPVWGPLRVTLDTGEHVAQIAGELEVTIRPVFGPGSSVRLQPTGADVAVRRWTASVTSPGTPPDLAAYLVGPQFKDRLQHAVRIAVDFKQITFPAIDVSFFGPLARLATSIAPRVRNGALLLGLNVENEQVSIAGNPDALTDFARGNDLAGVVNADAVELMLDDLHTRLVEGVEAEDAKLKRFSADPAAGYFRVSGAAGKSSGTVNFSFRVVPSMFHTRPGAVFRYLPKEVRVRSRTWPALGFRIEGVETDVDRAWWVILFGEVLLGILTAGFSTIYIESMASAMAANFSGQVTAAKPDAPANRVRRTIPPPGGVGVRIGVDQFEITAAGTYIGISARAIPSPAALLGPTSVPSTYDGDELRYQLRLPSAAVAADPALQIRWSLEDGATGTVLIEEDGPAAGRLRFDFAPTAFPGTGRFVIVANLYRRLGAIVTQLAIESVNLRMRGPLPPGAYIRWRAGVKTPQLAFDEKAGAWNYRGEALVRRWSEWHRTDAPCRSVDVPNRGRFDEQVADRLPFPLRLLENHRKGLCPYCFYGGPAGVNPAL